MIHDVAIIGGGPSGSALSILLRKKGIDVILLEKESFPRHHIGESLMPASYDFFKSLGMIGALNKSPFVRKNSVQFVSSESKVSNPFYFNFNMPEEKASTWQLERSLFDSMMLDRASRKGVKVLSQANVTEVDLETKKQVVIKYVRGNREAKVSAKIVADASGLGSLLSRRYRLRQFDPYLKKVSLYTYFANVDRDKGKNAGATIIVKTPTKGAWFWIIPLHDDKTSIGLVMDVRRYKQMKAKGKSLKDIFCFELKKSSYLKEKIKNSRVLSDITVASDFSYMAKSASVNRGVLVGDSLGFIDPVYSTGLFLGIYSSVLASDSIIKALENDDYSATSLGAHFGDYRQAWRQIINLVYAFYEDKFNFSEFLNKFPQHQSAVADLLSGLFIDKKFDSLFMDMKSHCSKLSFLNKL